MHFDYYKGRDWCCVTIWCLQMGYVKLAKANVLEYQGIEAIVNSTNKKFVGKGGLDAAIHEHAGVEFEKACKKLKGEEGKVYVLPGCNLPYEFVLSIIIPTWNSRDEEKSKDELYKCYKDILETARQHGMKTIAFPSLGTKARKIPDVIAAEIAIDSVRDFLAGDSGSVEEISFIVSESSRFKLYKSVLEKRGIDYFNVNQFFKDNITEEIYIKQLDGENSQLEIRKELIENYETLCDDSKDIVIKTKAKFGLSGAEMESVISGAIKAGQIIIDHQDEIIKVGRLLAGDHEKIAELIKDDNVRTIKAVVPWIIKLLERRD